MQTSIFETESKKEKKTNSEWGTFKDSLKAPVHSWFTYPAGFSYKAVEHSIQNAKLVKGKSTIYDPFMGSGTTNIVAKTLGYNSIGIEAHPFVYRITKSKLFWDIKLCDIEKSLDLIQKEIKNHSVPKNIDEFLKGEFPELVLKCFLPETLYQLWIIRESIKKSELPKPIIEFLRTALICVLREVSIAATGWPYIAPNKIKITSMSKQGWLTYRKLVYKMYGDITEVRKNTWSGDTEHSILLGDAKNTNNLIGDEVADLIFTSPPYLNNFDYADRTRLEMYFMGEAKNWKDISNSIRTKLMTSATTQISRNDKRYVFLEEFKNVCPEPYEFLKNAVVNLSELRKIKGGKKSYDLLTIGYFNDIYQIIKDNYRILRNNAKAHFVLGDSAPYGVHIPTDELIGEIGIKLGFKTYNIEILRTRGGKWAKNPQRHTVKLKESIVTLEK